MRSLLRLFVMWLIAVALPLQGVAAATMLHCKPAQGQAQAVLEHEGDAHAHVPVQPVATDGSDAGMAMHDHHRHGHDAAATAHRVAADPAGHPHHASSNASCSVCASCCSAAALPAMPLVVAAQAPTGTAFALAPVASVDFVTDGPERPPRTILA